MRFVHDINDVLELEKQQTPFFIFKHSTQCPISAQAKSEFEEFIESYDADYVAIKVIEDRALSNEVERKTGIQHQSPQVILLQGEQVLWHDSHRNITAKELESVWNSHKQE